MKIIVIRGPKNCGKTTTINKVFDYFTKQSSEYRVVEERDYINGDQKDFSAVISYNGRKIGFYSMGDYFRNVVEALKCYECKGCDILLCACNDRFKSFDNVIRSKVTDVVEKVSIENNITQKVIDLINKYIL